MMLDRCWRRLFKGANWEFTVVTIEDGDADSEVYGLACIYPAILYEHTSARRLLDLNTNLCFTSALPSVRIGDKNKREHIVILPTHL